jgi:hypothetical protein
MSCQALKPILLACALFALSACSSDETSPVGDFASSLQKSVETSQTSAGLMSTTTADLLDSAYKDSGVTQPAQIAYQKAQADAMTAYSDLSGFAGFKLSNVQVFGCDASNVCTMTATLTNADADTTTADITTKVKVGSDGKIRLFGDQLSA